MKFILIRGLACVRSKTDQRNGDEVHWDLL